MGIWPGKMHVVVEGVGCETSARCVVEASEWHGAAQQQ